METPLLVIETVAAIAGSDSAVVMAVGEGETLRVGEGNRIRIEGLACTVVSGTAPCDTLQWGTRLNCRQIRSNAQADRDGELCEKAARAGVTQPHPAT